MSSSILISADALHQFVTLALSRAGMSASDANTVADVLVTTDTWGVFTHGTKLLKDYVRRLRAGGIRQGAAPVIAAEGPAWATVDGQAAMGHIAAVFAMRTAIAKARTCGIAYVNVRNTCHFGAAGYYAWLAAQEGLIGVAMANDIPSVAAPGSRRAVTGSNPLAYAIPTGAGNPILLDMATSTVAGGKVYAAHQRGEPIPDNWIIGPDGRPTTDGSLYPAQAALAPMAGHKGFGIALLIETLSAVASGAAITRQVGSWIFDDPTTATHHGAAFLAIDVGAILPRDEFNARITALVAEIHAAPTADGVDRLLLPGEREWNQRRRALVEGIILPPDVVAKLNDLTTELAITPPWRSA